MTRQCQQLQVGQTVSIESGDVCFRVTILASEQPGPKVVEKGEDYIVLDDTLSEVRTRIPMHLISAVIAPPQPVAAAAA